MAKHFAEASHKVHELKWMVLEKIYESESKIITSQLARREIFWITELDTLAPRGLNEACNMSAFL